MKVNVKYIGQLSYITKKKSETFDLENETRIGSLIELIINKYPSLREYVDLKRGPSIVLLNGQRIEFLEGENSMVKDGDEVTLLPPLGGG
jgi:molybdopterin synthase sulfur carrier subunit